MSELKPCPFCGGAARAFKRTCDKDTRYDPADRAFPIVRCGACGACSEGDDWTELQTAIDRWNRRAQPAQAGRVLSDEDVLRAAARTLDSEVVEVSPLSCIKDFARAIEQVVLAKRVPMTDAQINDAYGEARVQHGHIPHDDVAKIVRAAERHHGIVGKEGI